MTREIVVHGRLTPHALRRALYDCWTVQFTAVGDDGTMVAVISSDHSTHEGFGVRAQADRLRSFGGVGVLEVWTVDELGALLERLGVYQVAS